MWFSRMQCAQNKSRPSNHAAMRLQLGQVLRFDIGFLGSETQWSPETLNLRCVGEELRFLLKVEGLRLLIFSSW